MTKYTKQVNIMQYTETVYYADGVEIARENNNDDVTYDREPITLMTEDEIEDYA